MLTVVLSATACKTTNILEDGKEYSCIGLWDDRDPTLVYKGSTRNMIIGVVFNRDNHRADSRNGQRS